MSAGQTPGKGSNPEAAPILLPAPMGDRAPTRRPGKPGVPPSSRSSFQPGSTHPRSCLARGPVPPSRAPPAPPLRPPLASGSRRPAEPETGGDGGPAGAGGAGTGNPRPLPGLGGGGGAGSGREGRGRETRGSGEGLRLRRPRIGRTRDLRAPCLGEVLPWSIKMDLTGKDEKGLQTVSKPITVRICL
nr:translation initiation factor IF-2-like [Macaca fascicularis]